MAKALFGETVLAESEDTIRLEGNVYFPPDSVDWDRLTPSTTRTVCPWKGVARYHSMADAEGGAPDVAWTYPRPWPLARRIRGYVAFWNGVHVEE
jgi:uncharacterized protein (DUF427 family)